MKILCKTCGIEFDASPAMLKRGRKFCSRNCANKALIGRVSPMKGKHHTEQARLKISLHNARPMIGKRPSQLAIDALTTHVKEHGPWNKKYADTNERFAVFRHRHKKQIIERNKKLHPYKNWNRRVDYLYRNLKARHGVLPYSLEDFRKWVEAQPKTCYLCGSPLLLDEFRGVQLDHRIPVKNNGGADFQNLGLACRRCNDIKDCYSVEEVMDVIEKWRRRMCQIQK